MFVSMRRELLLALILLMFGLTAMTVSADEKTKGSGDDVTIPDVVAKVNGVEIKSDSIKFQLSSAMRKGQRSFSPAEQREIVSKLVDKEIVRELVHQEGKAVKIEVDAKSVEKEFQGVMTPYKNKEDFQKALNARGLTEDELRNSIEVDLIAKKLIDEQVRGKIKINDKDVKSYYESNQKKFFRPEAYRARHIFISMFPPELIKTTPVNELRERKEELDKEAKKKVDGILAEIKSGGDFADLAKKYSHDSGSAQNGGDLDFIYKGVFDPAFDTAISKMKAGDVSDVVKTPFGYHIIKLGETKPAEQATFDEMEEAIQKHLFLEQAKERVEKFVQGLRKKAKIEVLL
jgi:peptidyl-prolyl cis-trans isomerase SurA